MLQGWQHIGDSDSADGHLARFGEPDQEFWQVCIIKFHMSSISARNHLNSPGASLSQLPSTWPPSCLVWLNWSTPCGLSMLTSSLTTSFSATPPPPQGFIECPPSPSWPMCLLFILTRPEPSLQLIDFGKAIDLALENPESQPQSADQRQVFPQDGAHWCSIPSFSHFIFFLYQGKYHLDYFGIAGSAYCLLFGKYIEVNASNIIHASVLDQI